ncbi:MAG TPA: HAD hydrolase family protein [Ilumatobacteraceae bacterium]|nr:HAD hydrolase family protein [Ilumatobacteraceae bacterium]
MVIALDVDGTLYDGVEVAPEALKELRGARSDGHTLVIVTGRRWEELNTVVPDVVELVARAVCEEGGVMVDIATGNQTLLAEPVEEDLVDALNAAGVPMLDVGRVVVGAPTTSLAVVTEVRDRIGSSRRIVTNKSSIALTPAACDKGTGLLAAMADLRLTGLPILAIGDAANDLPMFAVATIAVAVANADDAVRASGVPMTTATFGEGAAEALREFLPRPAAD